MSRLIILLLIFDLDSLILRLLAIPTKLEEKEKLFCWKIHSNFGAEKVQ